jgi:hypothetical protein
MAYRGLPLGILCRRRIDYYGKNLHIPLQSAMGAQARAKILGNWYCGVNDSAFDIELWGYKAVPAEILISAPS